MCAGLDPDTSPELINIGSHFPLISPNWLRQEVEKVVVRLWVSPVWPSEPQFPYL
jgi:hypothetical protein